MPAMDRTTVGYMLFNFCSATCIIFANKIVMHQMGYSYATLITSVRR